jgi:hypothetical protein
LVILTPEQVGNQTAVRSSREKQRISLGRGCSSVVEHLPHMQETLGFVVQHCKKRERERERERENVLSPVIINNINKDFMVSISPLRFEITETVSLKETKIRTLRSVPRS